MDWKIDCADLGKRTLLDPTCHHEGKSSTVSDNLPILYSKPPSKDIPKRLEFDLCFLRLITQSELFESFCLGN